jgi:uncharacterized membrane protein
MSIHSQPSALTGILLAILVLIPVLFALRRKSSPPVAGEVDSSARGRENPRRWVAGIFYVNPSDPALLVRRRFGLGWTMNFGHWISWIFLALLLSIPLLVRFAAARR